MVINWQADITINGRAWNGNPLAERVRRLIGGLKWRSIDGLGVVVNGLRDCGRLKLAVK